MEEESASKRRYVTVYQSPFRHIPEDLNLHQHRLWEPQISQHQVSFLPSAISIRLLLILSDTDNQSCIASRFCNLRFFMWLSVTTTALTKSLTFPISMQYQIYLRSLKNLAFPRCFSSTLHLENVSLIRLTRVISLCTFLDA